MINKINYIGYCIKWMKSGVKCNVSKSQEKLIINVQYTWVIII